MTYSRHQLQFRFIRGILVGLVIGAVLVFFARPFIDQLPFIGNGTGTQEKLTKAGKQAQELRDNAARGGGEITEEDLKSIAEGEAEEAAQAQPSSDEETNKDGGTETDPAEDTKEGEAEDAKKDDTNAPATPPSTGTRRVYEDAQAGFSLTLPSGWISETAEGQVQLKPEDAAVPVGGHDDTPAGLLVRTRAKSTSASLRDVYNGKTASNYYADASGGATDGTVDGHPSVTFHGVAGFESTTITVVDLGDTVVEIHDQGERRQADGTFTQVISSFQTN